MPPPHLRLQLLGPFEAWRDDEPIPPADWRGHKTRDLLKILVLARGEFRSTDQLIEWLWPGAVPEAAEANLRSTVSDLRRLLEPGLASGRASAFIHTRREGYRFNLEAPVNVDWLDLEAALAQPAGPPLAKALQRWPGPLLPEDPYADWAAPARDHLQRLRLDAWAALADHALAAGDTPTAIAAAESGLALDAARETLWRALMRAHHLAGDRAAALRAFDRCRAALSRDLGADPLPETFTLHQHLLQDDAPAAPVDAAAPLPPAATEPAWLFRLGSVSLVLWVLATAVQLVGMLAGWLRGSLVTAGDPGAEALPRLLADPAALAELLQQRYLLIPLGLFLLPFYAAWFMALRSAAQRQRQPSGGLAWLGLGLGTLDVLSQTLSRVITVAQVSVLPGDYAAADPTQRLTLITLWDLLRALAALFAGLSALAHPLAVVLLAAATFFAARRSPPTFRAARALAIVGLALYILTFVYTFFLPGAPWAVALGLTLAAATYAWLLALAAALWR